MSLATPLTESETKTLIEFREKSKDFIDDTEDHFLLRFLRARDLDVNSAILMLRKYVDWRNTNNDLRIISHPDWRPPDVIAKDIRYKITGYDGEGRPVLWVPMGRWEIRQHIQNGLMEDVFRFFYQFLDGVEAVLDVQRQKTGATQLVVILDMEELWLRKIAHYPSLQACLRFFREFEAYYPEILYVVYILNARSIFTYIFSIVKRILTTRTIGKIKIFNRNESVWKSILLANIPAKAIPIEYGGSGPRVLIKDGGGTP